MTRFVLDILMIVVALGGICLALGAAWQELLRPLPKDRGCRFWGRTSQGGKGEKQSAMTVPEKVSAGGKSRQETNSARPD